MKPNIGLVLKVNYQILIFLALNEAKRRLEINSVSRLGSYVTHQFHMHFVFDIGLTNIRFSARFCPSIFIFTITEIPCFWLLRLQLVECVQNNIRVNKGITCSTSINGSNPLGQVRLYLNHTEEIETDG